MTSWNEKYQFGTEKKQVGIAKRQFGNKKYQQKIVKKKPDKTCKRLNRNWKIRLGTEKIDFELKKNRLGTDKMLYVNCKMSCWSMLTLKVTNINFDVRNVNCDIFYSDK